MTATQEAPAVQGVLAIIDTLVQHRGRDNFATFNLCNDYYLYIGTDLGSNELYCETIGKLSGQQRKRLRRLGWEAPDQLVENYHCFHRVDSEYERQELARMIFNTAREVCGCHKIAEREVAVVLEDFA